MATNDTAPPPDDQGAAAGYERRVACAEINARRVNEALERGRPPQTVETFICECGVIGCSTKLTMALDAYHRSRAHFERFFVAPGHEVSSVDWVVDRCDGFLIVEKRGDAAELARQDRARDDGH